MPRKQKEPTIYRQRRDNYVSHFKFRQTFKALPVEMQLLYQKFSVLLPRPVLDVWGAGGYTMDEMNGLIKLANSKGLPNCWMLVPWYATDEGWNDFQKQWQELPDVVHMPPVDELGTYVYKQALVHISTWEGIDPGESYTDEP